MEKAPSARPFPAALFFGEQRNSKRRYAVILSSLRLTSLFTSPIAIFSHLFYDSQITYTHLGCLRSKRRR